MKSGDKCDKCGDYLHVRNTERKGDYVVQYLACRGCGARPDGNKVVIPFAAIRQRHPVTSS